MKNLSFHHKVDGLPIKPLAVRHLMFPYTNGTEGMSLGWKNLTEPPDWKAPNKACKMQLSSHTVSWKQTKLGSYVSITAAGTSMATQSWGGFHCWLINQFPSSNIIWDSMLINTVSIYIYNKMQNLKTSSMSGAKDWRHSYTVLCRTLSLWMKYKQLPWYRTCGWQWHYHPSIKMSPRFVSSNLWGLGWSSENLQKQEELD